ncbi:MAG: PIN domain-containing protein [Anaerolineae bacterium]|nr:PIN domain-containing protein [Anaerolineae bacterium]
MTMTGDAFVDTNILLRAFNSTFSEHPQVRALFDRMLDQDYELWISRQVIREYLVQMTHPRTFDPPLSIEQVLNQLATVKSLFRVADDTGDVTAQLEALLLAYPTRGKQIHDANIVATMLACDIDTLLTLNLDDFRRFEDRITILTPTS